MNETICQYQYLNFPVANQSITNPLLLSDFLVLRNRVEDGVPQHLPPRANLNRLRQDHRHSRAAPGDIDLEGGRRNPELRLEKRRRARTNRRSHITVHGPAGFRVIVGADAPIKPIGYHRLQRPAENQLLVLVDLEFDTAGDADSIGADVGDLRRLLIEAVAAEGQRGRFGGRNARIVDLKRYADLAAGVAEREVVGDAVDHARRDPNVEEPDFEPRRVVGSPWRMPV